jgi:2,3-dihydroxybenzoate decarboxylase
MINGHSNGIYLDHPSCEPLWERANDLAVPVFLHPADPLVPAPALDGVSALRGATWEWGFEAASHALRLVFAGVFARYPRARIVLSQLGEALPFAMTRLDRGARFHGVALDRPPSYYLRENVLVTTAGLIAVEPLYCAIATLGPDHVLFGTDYPFERADDAGHFLDTVRLDEGTRAEIARKNAETALALAGA